MYFLSLFAAWETNRKFKKLNIVITKVQVEKALIVRSLSRFLSRFKILWYIEFYELVFLSGKNMHTGFFISTKNLKKFGGKKIENIP
jgi:hypothetical protein